METLLRLKETLDELVELIKKNDHPEKNDRVLSRIRFLVAQLHGHDGYITEKSSRIASRAATYYTAKTARDPQLARQLLSEISIDLPGRIDAQINYLMGLAKKRDEA